MHCSERSIIERTKGHSLPYLALLLVLLPPLVVSRVSKQRPVNEASMVEKLAQSGRGLMIDSSLIAQPEEQPAVDYKPRLPRSPAVAHQQSTNTAAAKRDLHYKQLRRARGARDSYRTMIVRDVNALNEKRAQGSFLPGQINGLNEESLVPDAKNSRAFLPPKIVYGETSQLPAPFVRAGQQERGRAFALANFLLKNREPMSPRSFGFQKDAKDRDREQHNGMEYILEKSLFSSENNDETNERPSLSCPFPTAEETSSSEKLTDQSVLTPLTTKVINDEAMNEGYALFHRIVEEGADSSQIFDVNSVADEDEDVEVAPKAEASSKYEEYDSDAGETFDRFKDDARSEQQTTINECPSRRTQDSRYEFGYRVIDHGAGSDFGHEESHRVPGETNGRYHVLLPDGRVQRVEYYADDTGYHAEISYARSDDQEPHQKR
ncbi:hypothetical protein TSAR_002868 [Trichomalopsis sarcophagae]|uniref:Pro-resilin n=1 Tax=Trichomalopsis sarcophagae TaxID=543379 RepID=A0A232FNA8_9HYME|nr:hypothetical protein TSAR_002868 [Trichomalopsis sarcophagae]